MADIPAKRTFDFFSQQESNRKKTGLLVFLFVSAVVLIIVALYAAITAILLANRAVQQPFDLRLLLGVAGGTIALVLGGSLFKTSQLKRGGAAVAEMLGGRPVNADTKDPKEKRLLNVVEEMAIASGTPTPDVYILNEDGINACAAGWGLSDAAVCVTRGCLDYLSRDELQGVIGHEFSHVHNGDMRLNIRLMGLIFGILLIAQIGSLVLQGSLRGGVRIRSGKDKEGGGAALVYIIALALFIIGYIGVFFGNLIMAAVSRAREFLADASSVQFTRNPAGISGALKKIGGLSAGSRMLHPASGQASHLFFADGRGSMWSRLFATHPPLDKRISAIDPRFDGTFPPVTPLVEQPPTGEQLQKANPAPLPSPGKPPIAGHGAAPGAATPVGFEAALMLAAVGAAQPMHIAHATGLIQSIPERIKLAIRDPNGAQAVIFALVLSKDEVIFAKQLQMIEKNTPHIAPAVANVRGPAASIERTQFMTVASLAVNSLKALTGEPYRLFMTCLKELIEADGKISLFEYMIHCMVKRTIAPRISGIAKPQRSITSLGPIARYCAVVFSTLVWESSRSDNEAGEAFAKASALFNGVTLDLLPREQCTLLALDEALGRLAPLIYPLKKQLLSACISIVSDDGLVTVNEAEYVRTIAEALECPIPPMVS